MASHDHSAVPAGCSCAALALESCAAKFYLLRLCPIAFSSLVDQWLSVLVTFCSRISEGFLMSTGFAASGCDSRVHLLIIKRGITFIRYAH